MSAEGKYITLNPSSELNLGLLEQLVGFNNIVCISDFMYMTFDFFSRLFSVYGWAGRVTFTNIIPSNAPDHPFHLDDQFFKLQGMENLLASKDTLLILLHPHTKKDQRTWFKEKFPDNLIIDFAIPDFNVVSDRNTSSKYCFKVKKMLVTSCLQKVFMRPLPILQSQQNEFMNRIKTSLTYIYVSLLKGSESDMRCLLSQISYTEYLVINAVLLTDLAKLKKATLILQ